MKSKPVEDQYVIRLFRRDKDLPGLVQLRIDIEAIDQAGNNLNVLSSKELFGETTHQQI